MSKVEPKQHKVRRDNANSAKAAANRFAHLTTTIPLPVGCHFTAEVEHELWESFSSARSYADWRDVDLLMLWKLVKLERELRAQQELVEEEGAVVLGARGGPIENPRVRIMNLYEQRQLSIFRALGLNVTKSDPRIVKNNAAEDQKARRILAKADDWLAGPIMN